jgi:hypothetical protein
MSIYKKKKEIATSMLVSRVMNNRQEKEQLDEVIDAVVGCVAI